MNSLNRLNLWTNKTYKTPLNLFITYDMITCENNRVAGCVDLILKRNGGDAYEKSL